MENSGLLIVSGDEVFSLLTGREAELIQAVRLAYEAHAQGASSLPHSTFLRFPASPQNRIIALPAYLGEGFEVAGVKWIASFPGNLAQGLDRASAVLVLNSVKTGQPKAIIEGSIISARRTAASAVLAAQVLQPERKVSRVGIIGCGVINFEIVRFLLALCPEVKALVLFDLQKERTQYFKAKCLQLSDDVEITIASDIDAVLRSSHLISLATTTTTSHIFDLSACPVGSTILHISLRDLSPEVILACDNVVDDVDHVCREQTSVHLTEQHVGNRDFIRCTLSDVLRGIAPSRKNVNRTTVFSPFGLGILDMAVGMLVYDLALREKCGTMIPSFLPTPWFKQIQ